MNSTVISWRDLHLPGPLNVVLGIVFLVTGSWVLLILNIIAFIVWWPDIEW